MNEPADAAHARWLIETGQVTVREDTENLPDYLSGTTCTTTSGRAGTCGEPASLEAE